MPIHKSSVLVMRCQDWSETSQVVHLLARQIGRVRCLAKGSRRGLNPFSGPLDRWTIGEAVISLSDPNRLATLMELYETDRLDGLRRSLPAFYAASFVTDLVMTLVPDLEPQPQTFDLTVDALRAIAEAEPEACTPAAFAMAWRLLALLGYGIDLQRCVECGKALAGGKPIEYSPGRGGPVCPSCRASLPVITLGAKAVQAVAFLASADWAEVRRVRLAQATADQMRAALSARLAELAGRQLPTARYV